MNSPLLIGLTGRKRSGKDSFAAALTSDHGFDRVAFADPIKTILEDLNPHLDGTPASEASAFAQSRERTQFVEGLPVAVRRWTGVFVTEAQAIRILQILDPLLGGTTRLRDLLIDTDRRDWDHLKEGSVAITPQQATEIRRLQQVLGTEAIRGTIGDNIWVGTAMHWAEVALAEQHRVVITDCRFENEAHAIREAGGLIVKIERPGLGLATDSHLSERELPAELVDRTVVNDGTPAQLRRAATDLVAELAF